MNKYVSSSERKHLVRLGAVMNSRDEAVEEYSKSSKTDKEFLKAVKMMGSFAERALKIRMGYLDPEQQVAVIENARKCIVTVQWKEAAYSDYERLSKLDDIVAMDREHFYNMAEFTIEGFCKKCNGTVINCLLKKLFDLYELPIPYNDVPDNICVYSYMSKQEGEA